jgi:hypothetical protein
MTTAAAMTNAGRVPTATAADRSALTVTMHIPAVVVTPTIITTAKYHRIRLRHHHRPAAIAPIHVPDTAGQSQ